MLILDVESKVRTASHLLSLYTSAELRALGRLLLGPQHLKMSYFARGHGLAGMVSGGMHTSWEVVVRCECIDA